MGLTSSARPPTLGSSYNALAERVMSKVSESQKILVGIIIILRFEGVHGGGAHARLQALRRLGRGAKI